MATNVISLPIRGDATRMRETKSAFEYPRQAILNRYLSHLNIPADWKFDPDEFEAVHAHDLAAGIHHSLEICRCLRVQLGAYMRKGRAGDYYEPAVQDGIALALAQENRFALRLMKKFVERNEVQP